MTAERFNTEPDLVIDRCAGSALIIPLSKAGELFIADLNGPRFMGAAFCQKSYANALMEDAVEAGLIVTDRA
jgi:hypothetical protein